MTIVVYRKAEYGQEGRNDRDAEFNAREANEHPVVMINIVHQGTMTPNEYSEFEPE